MPSLDKLQCGPLPRVDCAANLEHGVRPGRSKLWAYSLDEIWNVTTKPTPDTVHSPTPGQLHVESIQLACTCALCCCYALCMKREELLIFYSFWLRCFVDMLQYVGFLGRSQLFGSQVKVGAPTWHLARANCIVGAPTAKLVRQLGALTLELARANCPILPLPLHTLCIPFPF